jgi:hypothetical protein
MKDDITFCTMRSYFQMDPNFNMNFLELFYTRIMSLNPEISEEGWKLVEF